MKYTDISKQRNIALKNREDKGLIKAFLLLIVLGAIGASFYLFKDKISGAFNPISIVSNVSSVTLKETDGRTNILVLGSDSRSTGAAEQRAPLTDTILVASIGSVDKDVVMISLPRDLWISDMQAKINAVYAFSEMNEEGSGAEALEKAISDVLGIPIHYHVLVTFDLFEQAIDILDGIEVNVDTTFTDRSYPVEGRENDTCGKTEEEIKKLVEDGIATEIAFPCRYETIKFEAGMQKMDGKTALKYVRSRHGDNNENTDFARSKRQQKIISAIKDKALSLQTVLNPLKLKELYDAYSKNVDTNVDLQTIQNLVVLSQQLDFSKLTSVVLDDRSEANSGGLLYSPTDRTLYGNQWVLIPQTGNFSQIHAYVQKYLFSEK